LYYDEIHCKMNKFDVDGGVFHRLGDEVWGINSWPHEVFRFEVRPLSCCSCWYLILDWGMVAFGKIRRWIQPRANDYLMNGLYFFCQCELTQKLPTNGPNLLWPFGWLLHD
jgi:hypothetical protein